MLVIKNATCHQKREKDSPAPNMQDQLTVEHRHDLKKRSKWGIIINIIQLINKGPLFISVGLIVDASCYLKS
jgi:hypothetical protein